MNYLLVTNIFISAKNTAFDPQYHPGYWDFIAKGLISKKIILLDWVYRELTTRDDELSKWIAQYKSLVLSTESLHILTKLQEVSDYVVSNKVWTNNRDFLEKADSWIVATALADPENITIVTNERLDISNQCRSPKIPAVARHFGCICMGHWSFLREVRPNFILDPSWSGF